MPRSDFKGIRTIKMGREPSSNGGMALAVAIGGAVLALFAAIAASHAH